MKGLNGKRIIIADGGNGIGAATAERLGAEGAAVVVGDINLEAAQAIAKRIAATGGTALAAEFDLADEQSVRALVDTAADRLGGVDGLYNVGADVSAGVLGRDGDLLDMDPAVWRRTLEVNLIGYAYTARAVLPLLLENGGGAIVNTSSLAAHVGDQVRAAYQASKAGGQRPHPPHRRPLGQGGRARQLRVPRRGADRVRADDGPVTRGAGVHADDHPQPPARQARRPGRRGRLPALRRRRVDQRPGLVDQRRRTAPRMKIEHTRRVP
jgi:NADP-dependent 3-hydroxy acid dehydrogenase YdfG